MEKSHKKLGCSLSIILCLLLLVSSFFYAGYKVIHAGYKLKKETSLFPQEKSQKIIFHSADYIEFEFEDGFWGIDGLAEKVGDHNPFADYWLSEGGSEIVFSMSEYPFSNPYDADYNHMYKKCGFTFPKLSAENISKIVFANASYSSGLEWNDDLQIYNWENPKTVTPNLTEDGIAALAEQIIQKQTDARIGGSERQNEELSFVQPVEENEILGMQEEGSPYLWHIRLYFNDMDGLFYNCDKVCLCKDKSGHYYLITKGVYIDYIYIELSQEIQEKFQISFENMDFGNDITGLR